MAHIVVEGPIGVGKTTVARLLANALDAGLVLEIVEENPFLASFYEDRSRFAFNVQAYFLLSRYRQAADIDQGTLFHTHVVSDYLFDKDWVFASMNLVGAEWDLYQGLYETLRPRLATPDLVVHLTADVDTLLRRIALRGRAFEAAFDPAYLEQLIDAYGRFFRSYDGPVLHVDAAAIDVVSSRIDADALLDTITGRLREDVRSATA